jgi:hypothetical protein
MRKLLFFAAVTSFAALLLTPASALDFKDIAGKWCGAAADYEFSRETLRVTLHPDNRIINLKVTSYEYERDSVRMNWIDTEGTARFTVFAEFAGNSMAQQRNDAGPRREFRRC